MTKSMMERLAKGERGIPPAGGATLRASHFAPVHFPKVPRTNDDSVVKDPDTNSIIERLNELARLNPDQFKKVLDEFGIAEPEQIEQFDAEGKKAIADRIRELLDIERSGAGIWSKLKARKRRRAKLSRRQMSAFGALHIQDFTNGFRGSTYPRLYQRLRK